MNIPDNVFHFIAEENNITYETVKRYYNIINDNIKFSDKKSLLNALNLLIQYRKTNSMNKSLIKTLNKNKFYN